MSAKASVAALMRAGTGVFFISALFLTNYLGTCDGFLVKNGRATTDDNVDRPETTIPQGTVQGINIVTLKNRTVSGFLGIPYARPPVGDLRFKAPQPAVAWNGTLNASRIQDPILCVQFADDGTIRGQEDCLYLNVFTPNISSTSNSTLLPVMLYIVGGAFGMQQNFPIRFGPDFILDKDVVLVVPNFRVNVLGYLSTGDEVAPGNYGLKDVVEALRWTRDNIRYFGGDPNRVTLFGGSSGGISVHLLALSDLTKGLFQRMITQSGSALYPRFEMPKDVYATRATQLGEELGCPTNTSALLIDCLRGKTVSEIFNKNSAFLVWWKYPDVIWAPTYEPEIEGALLTDSPAKLIAAGKMPDIPWINIVTWDEGLYHVIPFNEDRDRFEDLLDNVDLVLPYLCDYKDAVDDESAFTATLKSYYLNDLSANRSLLITNLTKLVGDALFVYPAYNAVQQQVVRGKSPLYFGAFKYHGTFSKTYSISGGSTEYTGVPHGEEIVYLYPYHDTVFAPPGSEFSKADLKMIDTMVELWTSFATNGTPTTGGSDAIWAPYSSRNNYLRIGNGSDAALEEEYDLFKDRMQFWTELTGPASGAFRNVLATFSITFCICSLSYL